MRSLEFLLPLFLVCSVGAAWLTPSPRSLGPANLAIEPSIPERADQRPGLTLSVADFPSLTNGPAEFTFPELPETFFTSASIAIASAPAESSTLAAASEASTRIDPRSDLLDSGAFRLSVPFRTQRDGSQFQGSNCGPAALGMVLEGYGKAETTSDLRWRSHTYQGTAGRRGGTALQHLATAGRDLGLEPIGLYQGQDFRRWSIQDIRRELSAGRPVVPLVKYRLLPGRESTTFRWDHYVVLYGMDGDQFLYHDPTYDTPEEGAARWISADQLDAAMRTALVRRQAVAFDAGARPPLEALAL